jgi:hypothetical protein
VTGISVASGTVTLPVSLSLTAAVSEFPEIVDGSSTRPSATLIEITVTVRNVVPGVTYNLYQYNDPTKVPQSNFNANKANAIKVTTFTVPAASSLKRNLKGTQEEINSLVFFSATPVKSPSINAPSTPVTKTPTKLPTKIPTRLPTKTPVKSPTKVPVKSPTNSPVKSPVSTSVWKTTVTVPSSSKVIFRAVPASAA